MYQTILFDFDGTIADSYEGITKCVQTALRHFDIDVKDRTELRRFIGPTLTYAFSEFYGLNEPDTQKAIDLYRAEYRKTGIYEITYYDGILSLIQKLHRQGFTVCIASAKPRVFLEQIIRRAEMEPFFHEIAGCELDGTRTHKEEIIAHVLSHLPGTDPKSVLMVGDRMHDGKGAQVNGVDFCGVLYGFGSKEELSAYHPVYLADHVADLERFLLTGQG